MTTLYIDRKGLTCKFENKALIFYEDGQRCGTIPTIPLKRVVFHSNVTLDTSVLAHLGQQGIGVTLLGGRSHQPSLYLPAQTEDARRRIAQYLLSQDEVYRTAIARKLLCHKCRSQQATLASLLQAHPNNVVIENAIRVIDNTSQKLADAEHISTLLGIEGYSATLYFQALASIAPHELHFQGRNRRPPKDPLNALLSLLYTLLYSEAALIAHIAGLDPYVGFLHALESGRASLACDIMEPLRPQVDLFALSLFQEGMLTVEQFTQSSKGCLLSKEGRTVFYPTYEEAAKTWRLTLQKDVKDLVAKFEADYNLRKPTNVETEPEE